MSQNPQSRVAPDVHPAGGGVVSNEEREYNPPPPDARARVEQGPTQRER